VVILPIPKEDGYDIRKAPVDEIGLTVVREI
jgi:hypothetical protein